MSYFSEGKLDTNLCDSTCHNMSVVGEGPPPSREGGRSWRDKQPEKGGRNPSIPEGIIRIKEDVLDFVLMLRFFVLAVSKHEGEEDDG